MRKIFCFLLCVLLLTACGKAPSEIETKSSSIEELLSSMTLEEKVGQMFIARCPDTDGALYAQKYQVGGYILFGRDFKDSAPDTFRKTVQSYQDSVKIPMFIAVDEEGGVVNRASRYTPFRSEPFPSPQTLYENGGLEKVREDAKEKSKFLLDLGINVNFAPVCDISQNESDFMYSRSVGLDPQGTGEYVKTVVTEMKAAGIGSVLKHFPGYGANEDTHTGISVDDRAIEEFYQKDFIPFTSGIKSGATMVLVSHNIVECMDKDMPASLSPEVHRVLREDLGFDGLIITDDLAMDAIGFYTDNADAAVKAILAGNDLICCSDFTVQIPAVIKAVKDKTISEKQIDESVLRILEKKKELGILN